MEDIKLSFRQRLVAARDSSESPEQLLPETSLRDLGIDSLAMVELVMQLEEALDVEIPDDELAELKTVADLDALAERITTQLAER
jgi:acyl carrier protein